MHWQESGGTQKLQFKNDSGGRLAVKVKCSDNALYKVNPVFAIVDPGAELTVEIVRNSGSPKEDKLVVCTKEAAADAKDATAIFKAGEATDMQTVALHADAIRI